jgi:MFS family permease
VASSIEGTDTEENGTRSSGNEPRGPHDPYAALRSTSFRLLIAGSLIATVGQQMQDVAVGWDLYDRTHRPLALGLVGLAGFLPVLALTLPAGHVADRHNRKYVVLASLAAMAAGSFGLALVSHLRSPVWLVYAILLANGVARAFYSPARTALLPEVVAREELANAATWSSGAWQLASVIGPALGGLVIGATHRATDAYLLDALFGLTFFILVTFTRPKRLSHSTAGASVERLIAGVKYVYHTKVLLAAVTLDMFAVLLGGATMLLPVFAKDILHVGPTGLGWMMAAPAAGAVVMAFALAHRPMRHAGRALILAVVGFGVATIIFGLSKNYALSLLMLVALGALDNISVIIRSTLLQLRTPDEMRGRVAAVNSLFIGTSNELGGFESGATAAAFGPVASVVGGGIGTIVVVLVVAMVWPEVRRMDGLDEERVPGSG